MEIEYQQRGAQHAHILLWTNPLFDLLFKNNEEISADDQEKIIKIAEELANNYVYSTNDNITKQFVDEKAKQRAGNWYNIPRILADTHICYTPNSNVNSDDEFWEIVAQLVFRLQMHSCTPRYCKKNDICRFEFPKNLREKSGFYCKKNDDGKNSYTLLTKRYHPFVNTFNPILLFIWRGNTDISFVVSPFSAMLYLCKYVTKSEKGNISGLLNYAIKMSNNIRIDNSDTNIMKQWTNFLMINSIDAVTKRQIGILEANVLLQSLPSRIMFPKLK